MSLNDKRDGFVKEDLYSLEKISPLFDRRTIDTVLAEVCTVVSQWPQLARQWQVPAGLVNEVAGSLRVKWEDADLRELSCYVAAIGKYPTTRSGWLRLYRSANKLDKLCHAS